MCQRGEGTRLLLGDDRDQADDYRRRQQGQFFPDQPGRGSLLEPVQGPVIQQQENHRQGHQDGIGHQARQKAEHDHQVSWRGRPPGVTEVSQDGQQPEKRRQQSFAGGDIGDRFHVERMQGEQTGHQKAFIKNPGHETKDQEQQDGIGQVEEQAGQVVPGRVRSV